MTENNSGMENHKTAFLQTIHQNVRQLTDFMRNELHISTSYDEEILGREVAKIIGYMSFNIDPLTVNVSADAVVNEFLRDTKNLTNITKYKNFRFYPLLKDNLDAVAACFGIYFITRIETVKGFAFVLPIWLTSFLATKGAKFAVQNRSEIVQYLSGLKNFFDTQFGPGDFGKDVPGGIYYFYKYFTGQPYFGYPEPIKEGTSIGWFKNNWKPVIESESGMSFENATIYFFKYYPYIKSGYFKTQNEFYVQARKDIADIAAGKSPKMPANIGGSATTSSKSLLQRIFGL
jgi:hypothetical protein